LISIIFILLNITTFTLSTLTIFQIAEYHFVNVYINDNTTEQTLLHSTERSDIISGFNIVEWICKEKLSDSKFTKE
jgi:hypothetical protein